MNILEFASKHGICFSPIAPPRPLGQLQPFEVKILTNLVEHRWTLDLASRQMGLTTLLSVYVSWALLFDKPHKCNYTMGYMTSKMVGAVQFLDRIKYILTKYDPTIKFDVNTKREIRFQGRRLNCFPSNLNSFRGWDYDNLVVDDASHKYMFQEVYTMILNNIASFGNLHMVSTGTISPFIQNLYDIENNFNKGKYLIYENSRYAKEHIEQFKKDLGPKWNTEMDLNEVQTSVFNLEKLLQFRVDEELYSKIGIKLIETNQTVSDYLRNLVKKDLY